MGLLMAGPLPKGIFDDLAKKILVKPRTVCRVWKLAVKSKATGIVDTEEAASNDVVRGFNGRKCRAEDMMEAVKDVPCRKRMTWEALAEQLGMPKSTIREHKTQGLFWHTSPLKPFLTDEHHIAQVDQCLSEMDSENPGIREANAHPHQLAMKTVS